MTYTPEQITAHIEHRAHCIGEDSKDVQILRQLLAECDAAWNDAVRASSKAYYDGAVIGSDNGWDFFQSAYRAILSLTKDNSHE